MKAIVLKTFGEPDVLVMGERDKPVPNNQEILIKVHATAINRADLLQRRGKYLPPEGASDILGLEVQEKLLRVVPK